MEEHLVVVELSNEQRVAVMLPSTEAPNPHVRRDLRRLARGPRPEDETRDLPSAIEIGKTMSEMIAAGVIGNAAWAVFPAAWEYLRPAAQRPHNVTNPEQLLARVKEGLDARGP